MINTELHNGDCLEYMKKISTSSIDLIITDPPYNLGKFMEERDTNLVKMRDNFFGAAGWDDLDYKEWKKSMNKFFHQASRVLKDGGSIIVFMAIIKVETIIQLAQKHGLYYKTTGIWHKSNPMPRNMNLHFVNSTESWIYFTYKTKTGTFNNNGKVLHGFLMLQESVYCKLALNGTAVNAIVDNVHKNKPEEGLIQLLTVTEKQYAKMDIVVGDLKSEVLDTDERLVIL